jgi:phosphofructokinase-like protein
VLGDEAVGTGGLIGKPAHRARWNVAAANEVCKQGRGIGAREDDAAGSDQMESVEAALDGNLGQQPLALLALDRHGTQALIVVEAHHRLDREPAETTGAVVKQGMVAAGFHRTIIDIGTKRGRNGGAKLETMRIGMLTAGGDCPGSNAVIRAITRSAIEGGDEAVGIMRGYRGLAERDYMPLDMRTVSGILPLGGTILRTSSYEPATENAIHHVAAAFELDELDAVIAIGGEHTMEITRQLHDEQGLPLIGVPKTIDNDIVGTDFTFGFDTAVHVVSEAIDRLHTTAQSHDRVMVVEVMGRNAGWIALYGGIAGGADGIVIPEVNTTCEEIAAAITRRHERGKDFSIVVVAEGADLSFESGEVHQVRINEETDEYGYERLGGIGSALGKELERMTGYEARTVVLGHIQRGGTPTAHDRVLATRYGVEAYGLAKAGEFGRMVALKGAEVSSIPLSDVTGIKTVDLELLEIAKRFFA